MQVNRKFVWVLMVACGLSGSVVATMVQERKTKQVTRVKRPSFAQEDGAGVYFDNLFAEGLEGERPIKLNDGDGSKVGNVAANGVQPDADVPADNEGSGVRWSTLISRTTIEDEVKKIQRQLVADITTPAKFKSDYLKVHQSFSILSMLFAIIREYDGDVRWKGDAALAQASFERAAANSRVGTTQAYESCKRRKQMLEDLVRGESVVGDEKVSEQIDWGQVIDRTPMMRRLQESLDVTKRLTASSSELARESSAVVHEAELVTAMAMVLRQPNMSDADDDGYSAFANEMRLAASETNAAASVQDFDRTTKAASLLGQSCDNCHADWR